MPDVKMRAHPRHTGLHAYMPSARPHTFTLVQGYGCLQRYTPTAAARVARVEAAAQETTAAQRHLSLPLCRCLFVCVCAVSAKLGVECWIAFGHTTPR